MSETSRVLKKKRKIAVSKVEVSRDGLEREEIVLEENDETYL